MVREPSQGATRKDAESKHFQGCFVVFLFGCAKSVISNTRRVTMPVDANTVLQEGRTKGPRFSVINLPGFGGLAILRALIHVPCFVAGRFYFPNRINVVCHIPMVIEPKVNGCWKLLSLATCCLSEIHVVEEQEQPVTHGWFPTVHAWQLGWMNPMTERNP